MDECRKQFEEWITDNGQWPSAADKRGDNYRLQYTESAWIAWQAAWNRRAEDVPECSKCANRGKLDGLSQEFYCDSCKYSKTWLDDNFAAAPEVKQ